MALRRVAIHRLAWTGGRRDHAGTPPTTNSRRSAVKFRTKMIEVEAIQYTGNNVKDVMSFLPNLVIHNKETGCLEYLSKQFHKISGNRSRDFLRSISLAEITVGDWIVRGCGSNKDFVEVLGSPAFVEKYEELPTRTKCTVNFYILSKDAKGLIAFSEDEKGRGYSYHIHSDEMDAKENAIHAALCCATN